MKNDIEKFFKNAKSWNKEMNSLRAILIQAKLEEEYKWSKPCYSFNGQNILIIQPFKKCLGMMFFKGALLKDPKKILIQNGPNSQSAKRMEFTSVDEILKSKAVILSYIKEAVMIEKSGQKVKLKSSAEPLPKELREIFVKNPEFKKSFLSLTPGRQRGYILYYSSAKQSSTRISRIEKSMVHVLKGKGLNDK